MKNLINRIKNFFKKPQRIVAPIYGYPYNDQHQADRLPMPVYQPTTPRDGFIDPLSTDYKFHKDITDLEGYHPIKVDGSPFKITDLILYHMGKPQPQTSQSLKY